VKPDLLVETGYRFDEGALGFQSFRAFLVAAEQANRVILRPASTGPDLDVYLPGEQAPAAQRPAEVRPVLEIRPDLWKNFVEWTPGWIRVYDRQVDSAVRFPEKEVSGDDPAYLRLREQYRSQPDRFVPITPIDFQTTLSWMQEFTRSFPDGPTRAVLEAALQERLPLREFTNAIRHLSLYGEWNAFRSDRVRKIIVEWARRHDLDIDVDTISAGESPGAAPAHPGLDETSAPSAVLSQSALPASVAVEELRAWAHRILDRMDAPHLLRLPAMLEQLLRE